MHGDRDILCVVLKDWVERHKRLTREGRRPAGVQTPPPARHKYLYESGIYGGGPFDGEPIWEFFSYIKNPEWATREQDPTKLSKPELAFDARVRAGRYDLLREWVLVFDERSRSLWDDQDRANVLAAIARSAQRIAARGESLASPAWD